MDRPNRKQCLTPGARRDGHWPDPDIRPDGEHLHREVRDDGRGHVADRDGWLARRLCAVEGDGLEETDTSPVWWASQIAV